MVQYLLKYLKFPYWKNIQNPILLVFFFLREVMQYSIICTNFFDFIIISRNISLVCIKLHKYPFNAHNLFILKIFVTDRRELQSELQREGETEREADVSSFESLPRWLPWPWLGWFKVENQELLPSLHLGTGAQGLGPYWLLSQAVRQKLGWMWSRFDMNLHL